MRAYQRIIIKIAVFLTFVNLLLVLHGHLNSINILSYRESLFENSYGFFRQEPSPEAESYFASLQNAQKYEQWCRSLQNNPERQTQDGTQRWIHEFCKGGRKQGETSNSFFDNCHECDVTEQQFCGKKCSNEDFGSDNNSSGYSKDAAKNTRGNGASGALDEGLQRRELVGNSGSDSNGMSSSSSSVAFSPPTCYDGCVPSFEDAVRQFNWRLKNIWAKHRWKYHYPEGVRKALSFFFPLDARLHEAYRHEMNALFAFLSPYVEMPPAVPIDDSCGPHANYTVVPVRLKQKREMSYSMAQTSDGDNNRNNDNTSNKMKQNIRGKSKQEEEKKRNEFRKNDIKTEEEEKKYEDYGNESNAKLDGNVVDIYDYCAYAKEVHLGAFTGEPRKKEAKIIDLFILGYDLDVLEIRLYELYHSVDYFVILESDFHTVGLYKKPMLFKQNIERYEKFLDKIIYFEVDERFNIRLANHCKGQYAEQKLDHCWEFERTTKELVLLKFIAVNEGIAKNLRRVSMSNTNNNNNNSNKPSDNSRFEKYLNNEHVKFPVATGDDLLLAGDPDEIPHGITMRHTKYCELVKQETYSWLMVYYPGRVDAMLKWNSRIESLPHCYGPVVRYSTYETLYNKIFDGYHSLYLNTGYDSETRSESKRHYNYDALVNMANYGYHFFLRNTRSKLNPPLYLHGGWHMTDYSYLPFILAKLPLDDTKPGYEPWSAFKHITEGNILSAQEDVWQNFRDYRQVAKSVMLKDEVPPEYKTIGFGDMPWVLKCNKKRYPTWFNMIDLRYFMRPNKSFYIDGEPFFARNREEWIATTDRLRLLYSDGSTWR